MEFLYKKMKEKSNPAIMVIYVTKRLSDKRQSELPGPIEAKKGDILYDFDGYPCEILYKKTTSYKRN
jgi:hypothetical protein